MPAAPHARRACGAHREDRTVSTGRQPAIRGKRSVSLLFRAACVQSANSLHAHGIFATVRRDGRGTRNRHAHRTPCSRGPVHEVEEEAQNVDQIDATCTQHPDQGRRAGESGPRSRHGAIGWFAKCECSSDLTAAGATAARRASGRGAGIACKGK